MMLHKLKHKRRKKSNHDDYFMSENEWRLHQWAQSEEAKRVVDNMVYAFQQITVSIDDIAKAFTEPNHLVP
jgi:hypothetical protein